MGHQTNGTTAESNSRDSLANGWELPVPADPQPDVLQDSQILHLPREVVSPVSPISSASPVRHSEYESCKTPEPNRRQSKNSAAFWEAIAARAKDYPLPARGEVFAHPCIRALIRISAVLQENAGSDPFYLSSYVAAELLQTDQRQAHRWLLLLCRRGILSLEKKGNRALASEYRYHA